MSREAGDSERGISVARFAGSRFFWKRVPRVALATLAHPGLNSAAAPRLVEGSKPSRYRTASGSERDKGATSANRSRRKIGSETNCKLNLYPAPYWSRFCNFFRPLRGSWPIALQLESCRVIRIINKDDMRSKQNRTLSLGLILNLFVCCCASAAAVTRSLQLPVLTLLTAQSTAPSQSKPLPAPARWRGLIGEYGPDDDILIIFEEDGKLCALFKRVGFYPLVKVSKNAFQFVDSGPRVGQLLIFTRDARGRATQVEAGGV